ncbi:hypothetical protein [Rhodoferax sp.]|uniref:hypothetical protein n=1 Tax=Rhodoferax sp. TaxID=50421 RepID=UPI0025E38B56|nr:hypothetical protein [Rhodoferax sp.]
MAWDSTSIKNSFYNIIGVDTARADAGRAQQLEQVRSTMLAYLGEVDGFEGPALQHRVAYAKDVQTLWFLRADLMGVLANRDGESAARARMEQMAPLFQGLLPKGLVSRSSRLR